MDDKGNNAPREALFGEFPPQTKEQWIEFIEKTLKGEGIEKLYWDTVEGLRVPPFYVLEDLEGLDHVDTVPGRPPFRRGTRSGGWKIDEEVWAGTIAEARRLALRGIEGGLDSVTFRIDLTEEGVAGVPVVTQADMDTLLEGLPLEGRALGVVTTATPTPALAMLLNSMRTHGLDASALEGIIHADPLGWMETHGRPPRPWDTVFAELASAVQYAESETRGVRVVSVGSHVYHEAGASIVEELAFTLAKGVEYMVQLTSRDVAVDVAARRVAFSFAVGSNYFMEIAKLRAARTLWSNIMEQFSPRTDEALEMYVHAKASRWYQTVYDPYVNMLRATTQAMSAVIAGAQTVTLRPFDEPFAAPDEFSRRISRNVQLLLRHESYLDKVRDPAGGSYYVEHLTDMVADAAWELFKKVESMGGMAEALRRGFVRDTVAETAAERRRRLARRRDVLVGTNIYPNPTERMYERIQKGGGETVPLTPYAARPGRPEGPRRVEEAVERLRAGADVGEFAPRPDDSAPSVPRLEPERAAQSFEEIRLATERYALEHGRTPVVFLLPTGNLHLRQARARFALNLFGTASFEVVENLGFESVSEGMKEAHRRKADVVVLCSADEEYAEAVHEALGCVGTGGYAPTLVVAGRPEATGVDPSAGVRFIYQGMDVIKELKQYQELLGIKDWVKEDEL